MTPTADAPMPLPQFLQEVAAAIAQWEEDFADYAEDYFDAEERESRQREYDRWQRLSQAAAWWRDHCPAAAP